MGDQTKPSVSVVGGGMAGIATSLLLAERGYQVTLYEATPRLGGALSAAAHEYPSDMGKEVNYECQPHLFSDWYENFFHLVGEVGLSRRNFTPMPTIGFLGDRPKSRIKKLTNNGSPRTAISNLFSGLGSPANLFLYYYFIMDVLTKDLKNAKELSNELTLNGYLYSRPYSTEWVGRFLDESIQIIWAVDSVRSSLYSFQCYAGFQCRHPTPSAYITTQCNSYDLIVKPLEKRLRELGVDICLNTGVVGITVEPDADASKRGKRDHPARVTAICVGNETQDGEVVNRVVKPVQNLVLAVPSSVLSNMLLTSARAAEEKKPSPYEKTVAGHVPKLGLEREQEETKLATLYVPFAKVLAGIPEYYVGLDESKYTLTFIRDPYLEGALGDRAKMVLAITISDIDAVPINQSGLADGVADAQNPSNQEFAKLVLDELHNYVDFDLDRDVIKDKVFLKVNGTHNLFLNIVGSQATAPLGHYPQIDNLFFAVGTRDNPISIASVETAVWGGYHAAKLIWERDVHSHGNKVKPIEPIVPARYSPLLLQSMKILLAPSATVAKCLVDLEACVLGREIELHRDGRRGDHDSDHLGASRDELIRGVEKLANGVVDGILDVTVQSFNLWLGVLGAGRSRRSLWR